MSLNYYSVKVMIKIQTTKYFLNNFCDFSYYTFPNK